MTRGAEPDGGDARLDRIGWWSTGGTSARPGDGEPVSQPSASSQIKFG